MLYPSIDSLMKKIDSKYTLVSVASKRAREMQEKHNCQVERPVSHKNVGKSLEEIDAGFLSYRTTAEEK